jgi:large subunit ribosomal protein L27
MNVGKGKDDTLFATADGLVVYDVFHGRKRVNIVPAVEEGAE